MPGIRGGSARGTCGDGDVVEVLAAEAALKQVERSPIGFVTQALRERCEIGAVRSAHPKGARIDVEREEAAVVGEHLPRLCRDEPIDQAVLIEEEPGGKG